MGEAPLCKFHREEDTAPINCVYCLLNEMCNALEESDLRAERYREALEKIAAPKRRDGTYNRCREACGDVARTALKDDHE